MRPLAVGLGLAVAGGLTLLLVHSAHADTGGGGDAEPTDVAERVSQALASHDPGKMRGEADALEREGYTAAAASLRAEADRLDPHHTKPPKPPAHPQAAMSAAGAEAAAVHHGGKPKPHALPGHTAGGTTPPSHSSTPVAASSPSGPVPYMPATTHGEDPQRALAQQMTTMLIGVGGLAGRNHEDKDLVKRFQAQEKLTADGNYGPGTATRVLQRYGIVPVVPFYWSKNNWKTQKKAFIAFVNSYATGDPERKPQYDALIKDTNRS